MESKNLSQGSKSTLNNLLYFQGAGKILRSKRNPDDPQSRAFSEKTGELILWMLNNLAERECPRFNQVIMTETRG